MCKFENCITQGGFCFETTRKELYCSKHKQLGMIDLKHKKCIHNGCSINPVYNLDGEHKGIYCNKHKK